MHETYKINPRWKAWVYATGGGPSYEFLIWISKQNAMFRAAHPEAFVGHNIQDQDAFTRWLELPRHHRPGGERMRSMTDKELDEWIRKKGDTQ